MYIGDLFVGEDTFNPIALTNFINQENYSVSSLDKDLNFNVDESLTKIIAIDKETNSIYPLTSVAAGEAAPEAEIYTRSTVFVPIPRFAERDSITTDEINDIRDSGSMALKNLESERDKRLISMGRRHEITKEFERIGAVKGIIYDGAGNELLDVYAAMGAGEQETLTYDTTAANFNINNALMDAKERCEDELGSYFASGFVVLQGKDVFKKVRGLPSTEKAFLNVLDNVFQKTDNRDDGYTLASNVRLKSYGRLKDKSGNYFLDPNASYIIPIADGFMNQIHGPSTISTYKGTILPYYVAVEEMEFNQGVKILTESRCITYAARPKAIKKIVFT